ncbi:MAG TPA: hypothetical protein VMA31_00850 [Bryobacteraceae bacterium]|nr:hypothetical protein [Bryobacteraceae bacterium]
MSPISLLTPILGGGIQNVNFVNGRVLTAADLTAERNANLQRQRLLGNCAGEGIVSGLEVTLAGSSVSFGQQVAHVTAGLAVNRNGDVLQLPADTDVALAVSTQSAPATSGLFAPCQPPQTQLSNPGVYILTVLPASGYQGQAPVTQLNSGGLATTCTSQYATAGVQFRLAPVTLANTGTGLQPALYALANQILTQLNANASASTVAPALSQLRNGLAHVCFGTEALAGYAANPFAGLPQSSSLETYGLVDEQRTSGLITDCEVPLAIMYWSPQGVQFVDMWSVRRSLIPAPPSEYWPLPSGGRRAAEGLAMFLQFQDHASSLLSALDITTLASVAAVNYFLYLPPVGLLQTGNVTPSAGFDYLQFFSGRTYRSPVFIEGARIAGIFRTAFLYPPIDLSKNELLWAYQVRENQQLIDNNGAGAAPLYLLFTNGQIPFQGEARYDLNYFNYANYF